MNPMKEAWKLLKGMNPLDDPRIQAHRRIPSSIRVAEGEGKHGAAYRSSGAARGHYDRDTVYEQQATRLARPDPRPRFPTQPLRMDHPLDPSPLTHKRRFEQVDFQPDVLQRVGEDTIDNSPPPKDEE